MSESSYVVCLVLKVDVLACMPGYLYFSHIPITWVTERSLTVCVCVCVCLCVCVCVCVKRRREGERKTTREAVCVRGSEERGSKRMSQESGGEGERERERERDTDGERDKGQIGGGRVGEREHGRG